MFAITSVATDALKNARVHDANDTWLSARETVVKRRGSWAPWFLWSIGDASKTASRNAVFRCNRVALPSRVIHAAPFRNDPRVSGPFRGRSRHLWWQRNSREIINNPCNDAPPPLSSLSLSKFQPCAAATWNIHDYDSERSCVQRNTGAKF